jgi:uncharacterized protein YciI
MSPRFAYIYFMRDDPDRVRDTVPRHVSYWRERELRSYLGGPFEDRSGGLITFEAEDEEGARRAVDKDPFLLAGLLAEQWLKQWAPE